MGIRGKIKILVTCDLQFVKKVTNLRNHRMESKASKIDFSPEERIRKLEAQVTQLKNVIVKLTGQDMDSNPKKSHKKARKFDFNLYKKRHVALHVCYFGWDYHGFAVQETTGKTIESELFKALVLTKLIKCREESNYHRCGRTDKGVSAYQQVITIDLRSNLKQGVGIIDFEGCEAKKREDTDIEIDYCKILNANLPPHIQILAWAPCPRPDFSARFDCISRTYKYYFPQGDLDLVKLNQAGQYLLGTHDYRNFCKMDVANGVVSYIRQITSVEARKLQNNAESCNPFDMCCLTIVGRAFLWHQIRCIVSVLFRVASGRDPPSVVGDLLDIEAHPRRPQYIMASEIPLNLFQCDYENHDLDWQYDTEAASVTLKQLQEMWAEHSIKATMFKGAIDKLFAKTKLQHESFELPKSQVDWMYGIPKVKSYVPLLEMDKCQSLDEKLAAPASKRRKNIKLDTENLSNGQNTDENHE